LAVCPSFSTAQSESRGADSEDGQTSPVVVGYAPHHHGEWRVERVGPLTDILYFAVEPDDDGAVETHALNDSVAAEVERLQELGCRVLLCVGGWGKSEGFPVMAGHDAMRARFIGELDALCDTYGFDGIDYDWEHPDGDEEMAAYVALIEETAAVMHEDDRIVTVAQAGWQDLGERAYAVLDRIHLMSYDHQFPQATLAKSQADVERLVEWGCPPEKIALGVPFYGRNAQRESRTYRRLVAGRAADPAINEIDGYAFNGPDLIRAKVDYIEDTGLAGIMIWQVYHDAADEASLLDVIESAMVTKPD